ncbi:MAG: SIS domain-containing protein [Pyrinomonadaceae bacterium]
MNQPQELIESLNHLMGERKDQIERAATIINQADHIYLSGIGASWHAARAASQFFKIAGRPVSLIEASELLHFSRFAPRSVVLIISRSGQSVEIVKLLQKARESDAKVIGITNTPDSPLFRASVVKISVNASFDHTVSVTMYSALAMAAGLIANTAVGSFDAHLQRALTQSLLAVKESMND